MMIWWKPIYESVFCNPVSLFENLGELLMMKLIGLMGFLLEEYTKLAQFGLCNWNGTFFLQISLEYSYLEAK